MEKNGYQRKTLNSGVHKPHFQNPITIPNMHRIECQGKNPMFLFLNSFSSGPSKVFCCIHGCLFTISFSMYLRLAFFFQFLIVIQFLRSGCVCYSIALCVYKRNFLLCICVYINLWESMCINIFALMGFRLVSGCCPYSLANIMKLSQNNRLGVKKSDIKIVDIHSFYFRFSAKFNCILHKFQMKLERPKQI